MSATLVYVEQEEVAPFFIMVMQMLRMIKPLSK